jgi:hypothetical protein
MFHHRFSFLLASIVVTLLAASVVRGLELGKEHNQYIINISFVLLLAASVFITCKKKKSIILSFCLAIPAVLCDNIILFHYSDVVAIGYHVFTVLFLGYIIFNILKYIFTRSQISFNTISASLCAYLLLAVVWALVYSLIEIVSPGSFNFSFSVEADSILMNYGGEQMDIALYYSLVTMTTLGYGDITPATATTRMFAAIEAFIGQLYLVVLVARLVGMQIVHSTTKK